MPAARARRSRPRRRRSRLRWCAAPRPAAPSACPTARRPGGQRARCRRRAWARRRRAVAPTPAAARSPGAIPWRGAARPRRAPPARDPARVCAGSPAPARRRRPRPRAGSDRARTPPRERSRRNWVLARPRGPLKWTRPSKGSGLRDGAAARSGLGEAQIAGPCRRRRRMLTANRPDVASAYSTMRWN